MVFCVKHFSKNRNKYFLGQVTDQTSQLLRDSCLLWKPLRGLWGCNLKKQITLNSQFRISNISNSPKATDFFNPPGLYGKRFKTSSCTHTHRACSMPAVLSACHSIFNSCDSCTRPVLLRQHFLDGETKDWDDKAVKYTESETDMELNWTQQFDHLSIFLTTRRPRALVHCSLSRCVSE